MSEAVKTRIFLEPVGDKFKFTLVHDSNDIPVLQQNQIDRMNDNNGFSKGRLFRKIASIDATVVAWARRQGYDMSDRRDVLKFLEKYPQYKTVRDVNTGRSGKVIVK